VFKQNSPSRSKESQRDQQRHGIVGRKRLAWHRLALHFGRARSPLMRVVPEPRWPGMWRVRHADDALSDMVNLSRAKDAAMSLALARLNQAQETGASGPRTAITAGPVLDTGAPAKAASGGTGGKSSAKAAE